VRLKGFNAMIGFEHFVEDAARIQQERDAKQEQSGQRASESRQSRKNAQSGVHPVLLQGALEAESVPS
jgi:hypothetical protein